MDTGLIETYAKYATIGVGAIMVGMTLVSVMLMDRAGRRTLHLYGLGGMFIFSIFITISMLIKVSFRIQLICSKFMGNFTTSDISPNANMLNTLYLQFNVFDKSVHGAFAGKACIW